MAKATAQELLDKRNTALTNMRNTKDKAEKENREMTAAEETEYDGWAREVKEFKSAYDKQLKNEQRDEFLKGEEERMDFKVNDRRSRNPNPRDTDESQGQRRNEVSWNPLDDQQAGGTVRARRHNTRKIRMKGTRATSEYQDAYEHYLLTGDKSKLRDIDPSAIREDQSSATVLQTDDDERAGYTVPSEQFVAGLLREVDDRTWIWRNSRLIIVRQAKALGIRKLTGKMSSWGKGSELSDALDNLDRGIKFGKKILTPSYFTGSARISRDLIRSSVEDIESLVYSEFARDLAEVIEQEDINGDGDGGPLGVMVADSDGISTARDISTNTTTTTFKPEAFYDAKYNMKQQYRARCRWMFHREVIRDVMKLRDLSGGANTGTFLMQPALRAGEPDTLLGLPIDENEFFPSTAGASNYYGLLAVWEFYVHALALDMEILRLDQTRASKNQIEYVGRIKLDGMPLLEEAFTRLQYAAA